MPKHLLRSLVLGTLCFTLSALAQAPVVQGVVNGASFTTLLAPGTLANVFGTGFGSDIKQVSVQIGGKPAFVMYASPTQLTMQIPVELQPGKGVPVVVAVQGQSSAPFNIDLQAYAPGIFTTQGIGMFQRFNGSTPSMVSASNPALPLDTLVMYAVGLGPTNPVVPTGTPGIASTVVKAEVLIGGQAATVLYSGLSASVGEYQVNFTVPCGLVGSSLPVEILIGNQVSNIVTLPLGLGVCPNGMVNAASAIQAGLPNGDVGQGSIFSIYGNNMGPTSAVLATSFPLPTTLSDVSVQVKDSGGATHSAILFFVYGGQINALLPSATALGQASLTVTYNGQTSAPQTFNVVKSSVGLFARNSAGSGPGIVQQYHNGSPTLNDISNSAIPGDTAVLWGTGFGPISGDETQAPAQTNLGTPAEVWVGGEQVPPANIAYEGRSSSAGEDQINFVIPNITGCYVPVMVKIGNLVSNTVSMSIGAGGGMCSDPLSNYGGLTPAYVQAHGMRQGSVTLIRSTWEAPTGGSSATDIGVGVFESYNWTQLAASQGIGVSVYGACTVFTFSGTTATASDPIVPTFLDAGALSLVGPSGGTISIPETSNGVYNDLLGTSANYPGPLYLSPGNYTLTAKGGADVGAFTSTLTLPAPVTWTNMDAITSVTRANGVTVNWTGGTGNIMIEGYSQITTPQNAGAIFICYAQASAGSFTVPPNVLLALPVSATTSAGAPLGALMVSNGPPSATFNPNPPTGLDVGTFSASFTSGKLLGYN